MNVLILGSGGREHALAWKIKQSEYCDNLFCMPGNPGTAQLSTNLKGDIKDFEQVKNNVLNYKIDLVIVGPEDPLVNGIANFFANDKLLNKVHFIGPSKEGAMLEGSKDIAKDFMRRHNIPTAKYRTFDINTINEAELFIESLRPPYVLKADGLAAGKGVLIVDDKEEAKMELKSMLSGKFGAAGNKVVIEEFLNGIELSVFVLTDAKSYLILPEAKDYKRIGEGDSGLNTGGMGAVSPVCFADLAFMQKVEERIIKPTIDGLAADKIDYKGFVFIGLMNCNGDPYVIEYNVRMGDPETEAVLTRIDSDLLAHLIALSSGKLKGEKLLISDKCALTVVCVSGGYPESFEKGLEINGLDSVNALIFHSGTKEEEGKLLTNGGRVFAVTTNDNDIKAARANIYKEIDKILYKGKYRRGDIGLDLINFNK